jgi:phage tail-like protein
MSGRVDPFHNARFLVEIDGIVQAGFHEVLFGSAVTEVIEYREGNDPPVMRKLSGLMQYRPIRLIWGITSSTELYAWFKACSTSGPAGLRKNMAIVLLGDDGSEKVRWNVVNAWPCRYIPPDLSARECRVAIEMLEIVHEGFSRVT